MTGQRLRAGLALTGVVLLWACSPGKSEGSTAGSEPAPMQTGEASSSSAGTGSSTAVEPTSTSSAATPASTSDGIEESSGTGVTSVGATTEPGTSSASDASDSLSTTRASETSGTMCETGIWMNDAPDPCDAFVTEDTCLAHGCTFFATERRFTIDACHCVEHGLVGTCFKTANDGWGGSAVPFAIYRVQDGAVEVLELGHKPFVPPNGWHLCWGEDVPAACGCACDGTGCFGATR